MFYFDVVEKEGFRESRPITLFRYEIQRSPDLDGSHWKGFQMKYFQRGVWHSNKEAAIQDALSVIRGIGIDKCDSLDWQIRGPLSRLRKVA